MKLYFETDNTALDAIAVADVLHGVASLAHIINKAGEGAASLIFDRYTYRFPNSNRAVHYVNSPYPFDFFVEKYKPGERTWASDLILEMFLKTVSDTNDVKLIQLKIGSLETELGGILKGIGGILRRIFGNAIQSSTEAAAKKAPIDSDVFKKIIDEIFDALNKSGARDLDLLPALLNASISKTVDGLRRIGVRGVKIKED